MTAEPNSKGGHNLFSASFSRAVKLALLFKEGKHGGAVMVIDFTDFVYFAAKASVITHPMECATK